MSRVYTKDDVTVLSWDGDSGVLTELGSGTLSAEAAEFENGAICDDYSDSRTGKITYTFTGELAGDTTGTNWFAKIGEEGNLVFQSAIANVSGVFACINAELKLDDATRWNVTLKSRRAITVS